MIRRVLGRRFISLLLLSLLSLTTCLAAQQPKGQPEPKPQEVTVYITRTGAKYHRDGCRYLKSRIRISLKEAKDRGYTPCKGCRPPQ
jgi:hypothetical protein